MGLLGGGSGGFNGTSFIGDSGGINLSGLPFVGGLFPNAAQQMQRQMQANAANTLGAMQPGLAQGFQNIWSGVQQAYTPAQRALFSIYGGGDQGSPPGGGPVGGGLGGMMGKAAGGTALPPDPWSPNNTGLGQAMAGGFRPSSANPGGFMGQIPIVGGMLGGMGGMMPGGGGLPGMGGGGGMIPGMGGPGAGFLGGLTGGSGGGLGDLLKGIF